MSPTLIEGETDPSFGKVIKFLVLQTDDFFVYIDTNLDIQWSSEKDTSEEFGKVLNRVSRLECKLRFIEDQEVKLSFKRQIAEGIARFLEYSSIQLSDEIHNIVELQIDEMNKKISWDWYFKAAYWITVICLFAWVIFWCNRNDFSQFIGKTGFEIILGGLLGSAGALISVISRGNQLSFDANAGKTIHQTEGAARIIVGIAGACLAALALKSDILLSGIAINGNEFAFLLLISIIAGTSERLIPNLIGKIESISQKENS